MNNSPAHAPTIKRKAAARLTACVALALSGFFILYQGAQRLDYEARMRFWEKFMVEGHGAMRDHRLQHALESFSQAVTESHRFNQPDIRTAISFSDLAASERFYGKFEDAEKDYANALKIYESLEKTGARGVASQMLFEERARAHCGLGNVYLSKKNYAEAEKNFEAALARYRAAGDKAKVDPLLRQDFVCALAGMAETALAQQRFERAEPFYVAAVAMIDKCVGMDSLKRSILLGYARVLQFNGDRRAADAAIAKARITGSEKRVQQLLNEGKAALINRHFGEAEAVLKLAQDEAETVDFGEPFIVPLRMLAQLFVRTGRFSEAEAACERALSISSQADVRVDDEIDKTLKQLVFIYMARGEYARALPLLERQLQLEKTTYSSSGHRIAETLSIKAYATDRAGHKEEADRLINDALTALSTAREMPRAATGYSYIGKVYFVRGDLQRAQDMLGKAVAIRQKTRSSKSAKAADCLKDLALVQMARGNFSEAHAELQEAIELMRLKCEDDDPLWISVYGAQGQCLEKMGREDEAESAYQNAFDAIAKNNFIHGEEAVQAADAYASLLKRKNKTSALEAVESYLVHNR